VKESPQWLQDKLHLIGLRPINNIVDITNYIMFAYGQPLHCFDADMVEGKKIVVRTMPEGTPFVTLDGVEHKLSERDLAICNSVEPMCIAGVFGGKGSGTYETTKNIVLESAYFNPTWIRKSARRHGLSTDASFRFERGIDPNGQIYAIKQAAILCKELAGGEIAMDIKDIYPHPMPDFEVNLDYSYVHQVVGKTIPVETIKSIVSSLEMKIAKETADGLTLVVPAYRVDVQRPCDVVEDILRIYGYNNVEIPTSLNSSLSIKGDVDRSHRLQNLVGEMLVGCGFNEILNNSLTKSGYYDKLQCYPAEHLVRLMNPLSADLNVMRQTLLFGGMESIARNVNRKNADLRFFEFGNTYCFQKERRSPEIIPGVSKSTEPNVIKHVLDAYSEDYHLGLWLTGKRINGSWAHPDEDASIYELKAYMMNIFARTGVKVQNLVFADGDQDIYRRSLVIKNKGGKVFATIGVVSSDIQKLYDLDNEVYYADINWKLLMKSIHNNIVSFTEISRFPVVSRDLALLVDKEIEFAQIEQIAYNVERKFLKEVRLFDVYEGKNLEAGKKSYAVNFLIQDEQKTLTDKQIDSIMTKIVTALTTQLQAKLR
jgi:phenylalanyl-tRNA synthetase beta chain